MKKKAFLGYLLAFFVAISSGTPSSVLGHKELPQRGSKANMDRPSVDRSLQYLWAVLDHAGMLLILAVSSGDNYPWWKFIAYAGFCYL